MTKDFSILLIALSVSFLPMTGSASEPPKARATTLTFYVSGVECPSCVYVVCNSVTNLDGVTDISLVQLDGYANVTFDPGKVGPHQIAQAIFETIGLHGSPYLATLLIRVPEYAKNGNAAKVDEVFSKSSKQVKVALSDRATGEFTVSFLPLKVNGEKEGPQGWELAQFAEAIQSPAPKGLGLEFSVVKED